MIFRSKMMLMLLTNSNEKLLNLDPVRYPNDGYPKNWKMHPVLMCNTFGTFFIPHICYQLPKRKMINKIFDFCIWLSKLLQFSKKIQRWLQIFQNDYKKKKNFGNDDWSIFIFQFFSLIYSTIESDYWSVFIFIMNTMKI